MDAPSEAISMWLQPLRDLSHAEIGVSEFLFSRASRMFGGNPIEFKNAIRNVRTTVDLEL
jgi:hypothetical protein